MFKKTVCLGFLFSNFIFAYKAGTYRPHAEWGRLIGAVTLWNRGKQVGRCTGTLVGHRLVLTASHCTQQDPKMAEAGVTDVYFQPAVIRGKSEIGADRVRVATTIRPPHSTLPPGENVYDWALLYLEKQPISKLFGGLGAVGVDYSYLRTSKDVIAIGYSERYDAGDTPSKHFCDFGYGMGKGSQLFSFNCGLGPGASGGPVMAVTRGKEIRVIGVVTGGSDESGLFLEKLFAFPAGSVVNRNIAIVSEAFISLIAQYRKTPPELPPKR